MSAPPKTNASPNPINGYIYVDEITKSAAQLALAGLKGREGNREYINQCIGQFKTVVSKWRVAPAGSSDSIAAVVALLNQLMEKNEVLQRQMKVGQFDEPLIIELYFWVRLLTNKQKAGDRLLTLEKIGAYLLQYTVSTTRPSKIEEPTGESKEKKDDHEMSDVEKPLSAGEEQEDDETSDDEAPPTFSFPRQQLQIAGPNEVGAVLRPPAGEALRLIHQQNAQLTQSQTLQQAYSANIASLMAENRQLHVEMHARDAVMGAAAQTVGHQFQAMNQVHRAELIAQKSIAETELLSRQRIWELQLETEGKKRAQMEAEAWAVIASKNNDLASLQTAAQNRITEWETRYNQLQTNANEYITHLQGREKGMSTELAKLATLIQDLQSRDGSHVLEKAMSENEKKELQREIVILKSSHEADQKTINELSNNAEELKQAFDVKYQTVIQQFRQSYDKLLDEKSQEITKMELELTNLRQQKEQLSFTSRNDLSETYKLLEKERGTMQTMSTQYREEMARLVETHNHNMEIAHSEIEKAKKDFQELRLSKDSADKKHTAELTRLKAMQEQEIENLKKQIKEGKGKEALLDHHNARITELQQELQRTEKQRLEAMKESNDRKRQITELTAVLQSAAEMEEDLSSEAKTEQLWERLTDATNDNEVLAAKLKTAQAELEKAREDAKTMKGEYTNIRGKLEITEARLKQADEGQRSMKSVHDEAALRLIQSHGKMQELLEDNKRKERQIEALTAELQTAAFKADVEPWENNSELSSESEAPTEQLQRAEAQPSTPSRGAPSHQQSQGWNFPSSELSDRARRFGASSSSQRNVKILQNRLGGYQGFRGNSGVNSISSSSSIISIDEFNAKQEAADRYPRIIQLGSDPPGSRNEPRPQADVSGGAFLRRMKSNASKILDARV